MEMAKEKIKRRRGDELALQMDESSRPQGNEAGNDSRSIHDHIRSFLSLSAKGTYRLVGNAEEDGEKTRTAGGKKTMPFIIGNSCSCIESQKSLHEF